MNQQSEGPLNPASLKPVLLVEDSPDDVFIMRRAWAKAQFLNPLVVVTDGQLAVDYLSNQGQFSTPAPNPVPCLVLLDIKLPFLSGHDVVAWLRKYEPCCTIPAVFLTSSNADMDIHRAYKLGGNAYLVKPPTPDKLAQMLEDLKNFWIRHNHFPPECLISRRTASN